MPVTDEEIFACFVRRDNEPESLSMAEIRTIVCTVVECNYDMLLLIARYAPIIRKMVRCGFELSSNSADIEDPELFIFVIHNVWLLDALVPLFALLIAARDMPIDIVHNAVNVLLTTSTKLFEKRSEWILNQENPMQTLRMHSEATIQHNIGEWMDIFQHCVKDRTIDISLAVDVLNFNRNTISATLQQDRTHTRNLMS